MNGGIVCDGMLLLLGEFARQNGGVRNLTDQYCPLEHWLRIRLVKKKKR